MVSGKLMFKIFVLLLLFVLLVLTIDFRSYNNGDKTLLWKSKTVRYV